MCPKAMAYVLASPHSHKCLKLSWKKSIIGSEHSILIWTCSFLMTNEVMTIPHAYDYLGNTGVLLGPFVPFCTKLFAFLLIFKCMKSLKHCRKRKADYKPSSQFPLFQCSLCLPFWAFSSHIFSFLLIVAGWFHTPDGLSYCPLMHSFHLWSWNISCCFNGDYWDLLCIYGNLHASCTLEEKFFLKFSSLVLSCSLLNILVIDLWSHYYFKDPWHVIDLSASLLSRRPPRLLKAWLKYDLIWDRGILLSWDVWWSYWCAISNWRGFTLFSLHIFISILSLSLLFLELLQCVYCVPCPLHTFLSIPYHFYFWNSYKVCAMYLLPLDGILQVSWVLLISFFPWTNRL